ncbi:hypothetical protein SAMN06265795_103271 [Noviherbaspirillum humi]|uniref:Uncharacterized protein n=1 Tax=Noviherbaspirillum humi TaxID=1688639 RepID=A0A239FCD4_9BURK|nr:hypothetical protein [Noviherbaspirillum humi]SNS53973.1 hypothetical protein SAMN06265795_103271 [Noviherbaspirillum humi]
MENDSSSDAYILDWDLSHLIDLDNDASIVKFQGCENTIRLALTHEYGIPPFVEFEAIFDTLQKTDFPTNNVRWPIMSATMLATLTNVGSFPHKLIPVVMIDCRIGPYANRIAQISGAQNRDFTAVQLLEHSDLLDWENSIVDPSFIIPDQVMGIQKLVLRKPNKPLPPLFHLSAYPTALLVSSEARLALKEKQIKGLAFSPVENFQC